MLMSAKPTKQPKFFTTLSLNSKDFHAQNHLQALFIHVRDEPECTCIQTELNVPNKFKLNFYVKEHYFKRRSGFF